MQKTAKALCVARADWCCHQVANLKSRILPFSLEGTANITMEPAREYFWGCELTKEKPTVTWTFEEEEGDSDYLIHTLFLKHAVLGASAVSDERNIVQIETTDFDNAEIKQPLLSLTLGKTDMCSLDVSFGHEVPVTFRLVEGTGPLYLSAQQLVEFPDDANQSQNESELECTETEEEDLEEDEEESPTKASKAKKRKASSQGAGKAKSDEDEEDEEEDEEEDMEEDEDEDEDEEDEESSPEKSKKSKGKKTGKEKEKKAKKVSEKGKVSPKKTTKKGKKVGKK